MRYLNYIEGYKGFMFAGKGLTIKAGYQFENYNGTKIENQESLERSMGAKTPGYPK